MTEEEIAALVAERDLAVYEQDALRAWQEKAFQAHPNIDLDIDAAMGEQK